MKEIKHIIKDELGLHARPAGRLVKLAGAYKSDIRIGTSEKMVDAKRIMGVMGLSLKCGHEVLITFDGPDEKEAAAAIETFLKESL